MAEKKVKKHQKIQEEINRMRKADDVYCDLNSCSPNEFMNGKTRVYQDLLRFIAKL